MEDDVPDEPAGNVPDEKVSYVLDETDGVRFLSMPVANP